MKLEQLVLAGLIGLSGAAPVVAQDSVARGSEASVGASVITGSAIAWAAHAGSEFTVTAIKTSAKGVELALQGASKAVETSALVTKEALESAAVAVGTSVTVVAEASGYALMAAGKMIAFVPNEMARSLLHRTRR